MFKNKLKGKNLFTDFDELAHISVEPNECKPNGEIGDKWLSVYANNITYWNQVMIECTECDSSKKFVFHEYCLHKAEHQSFTIYCPANDCLESFRSQSAFMNHYITHHEHLAFTCINCPKIFCNIPSLLRHYVENHPNISLYVCIECHCYCDNLSALDVHLQFDHNLPDQMEQENQEMKPKPRAIKASKSTTGITREVASNKKVARPRSNSTNKVNAVVSYMNLENPNRVYHRKTRDFSEDSLRPTYPCQVPGCNNILLTASGYDYHQNVHADIRPFPCSHCEKSFRSKQSLRLHEKVHNYE